jgi:hypothetical protein
MRILSLHKQGGGGGARGCLRAVFVRFVSPASPVMLLQDEKRGSR